MWDPDQGVKHTPLFNMEMGFCGWGALPSNLQVGHYPQKAIKEGARM